MRDFAANEGVGWRFEADDTTELGVHGSAMLTMDGCARSGVHFGGLLLLVMSQKLGSLSVILKNLARDDTAEYGDKEYRDARKWYRYIHRWELGVRHST